MSPAELHADVRETIARQLDRLCEVPAADGAPLIAREGT